MVSYRSSGEPVTSHDGFPGTPARTDYISDPEFDDFEAQDDTRDGHDVSGNIELNTRFGNGGHFRIAGLYVDTNRDEDETRSEEHTSELQSLMRISYAVFCLKKKKKIKP